MANKITLGKRPKTFKPLDVTFTLPDGSEGVIPDCVFTYRTRTEFGQMVDANIAAANEKAKDKAAAQTADGMPLPVEPFSMEKHVDDVISTDVGNVIKHLESWGLDEPLNAESLAQLADECPAGIRAFASTYRAAVMDGYLGN